MLLDLQMFAGGHSVTIQKGDNVTTATASSSSDVQKDAEVTLTIVVADGYKPEYQVIAGGVTLNPATKKFTMGEADVVIVVTAKATNVYRVTEECVVNINGNRKELHRNVKLTYSANGAIKEAITDGTTISDASQVEALIKAGLIEAL